MLFVNIKDLISYYEYVIAKTNRDLEIELGEYEQAKVLYENKFLHWIFGLRYVDSKSGDIGWSGKWNFLLLKELIVHAQDSIRMLKYHYKVGLTMIDINDFMDNTDPFYRFADQNGLPS